MEIDPFTLEERANVLSMQGLASRSPQLDVSSREEMYYPRSPIRWSTARAAPPWYPHVQLDVVFLSLIPQARRKRLDGSQQHDGMVVMMLEVFPRAGLRQATCEGERGRTGGGAARAWGVLLVPHPPPLFICGGERAKGGDAHS